MPQITFIELQNSKNSTSNNDYKKETSPINVGGGEINSINSAGSTS